jgi:hypothetical protein
MSWEVAALSLDASTLYVEAPAEKTPPTDKASPSVAPLIEGGVT